MKAQLVVFSFGLALVAGAVTPSVTVGTLTQDMASKRVTIPYELSAGDACIVTFDIQTNGVSVGGRRLSSAWGDVNKKLPTGGGSKRIFWNPVTSDDFQARLSDLKAVVSVWPTNSPPDYLVVDLSGYKNHRFYPDADSIPFGVSHPLYKTDYMVFRKIPAKGVTWRMGAGPNESEAIAVGRNDALHLVTLPDDYYMGIYEVTQRQDRRFVDANIRGSHDRDFSDSAMRPVSGVSLYFARYSDAWPKNKALGEYSYLGDGYFKKVTGLSADFPTETQWEFAARGGTRYPFGSSIHKDLTVKSMDAMAWNKDNADGHVHVVGTRAPNDWGLYDMCGNVREWCCDYFRWDYGVSDTKTDFTTYPGPTSSDVSGYSNARVLRGGAYDQDGVEVSATARNWGPDTATSAGLGGRLILPVAYPL